VFISNSDNLGAVPDPKVAGWFVQSGSPFAIEAVRRTASDRKGGHFAIRKSDGRIVLRETAQTRPEDAEALGDLSRHRFMSTNNIWINLPALREVLDSRDGIIGLPLIRNVKTVDPGDKTSPAVIQIESAMGAAIEIFAGAQTIEVPRSRYVPVKTTNDLLVLRSDVYEIGPDFVLGAAGVVPFVDLDGIYKLVADFDVRFKAGAPSLREAESFVVDGDWTFGENVKVVGAVKLTGERGRVDAGTVLTD
jgi:UTP--glucose-1-phosphate uridylyltransferase